MKGPTWYLDMIYQLLLNLNHLIFALISSLNCLFDWLCIICWTYVVTIVSVKQKGWIMDGENWINDKF